MDTRRNRRRFLTDVGGGMLLAGMGSVAVGELGLAPAFAGDEPGPLRFGAREPLVALMQETPADRIVPVLVEKLRGGTELRELVAAAALANARTFGGEDYVGFHTMMALAPAYAMSRELPAAQQALPVLKVLHRNTSRIQEIGGPSKELLRAVEACCLDGEASTGESIREAVRKKDLARAEQLLASVACDGSARDAFNAVLFAVQDNTEVHRVVMPYRAFDLLGLVGDDQAVTMLRQSVHYCVKSERDWKHTAETDRPRVLVPALFDQYKLQGRPLGTKPADDAWVDRLSRTFFEATPDAAADAAAAALAEGMAPDAIGEAIALAANQLILRDKGRTPREVLPNKPAGSVHGDSIGVHACDSANAWRNMARLGNPRNTAACLILGAYQVALDRVSRGGDFQHWTPRPLTDDLEPVTATDPAALLMEAEAAIRANEQGHACAAVHRYGELGHASRPVFDLLLKYAVSEDGALHAEKYYRTVSEEFATARPAFRWRQLVGLARVTASEFGRTAPGYAEARQLLNL